MRSQARATRCSVSFAAAICATLLVSGNAAAVQDVQLTTVRGDASIADGALTERGELPEDQELKTGENGNASVLVDRNAVVELCGRSQVRFRRDKKAGTRIINVQAGDVKLIVEPRAPGERIEIHTPAAIATILGTVVYVSVDPVTGATTISSSQSQVNIRSKEKGASSTGTTINAYEQLSVVPGEQNQAKKSVTPKEITALTSCLLDFHDMAIEMDRIPVELSGMNRVAAVDIGGENLPSVSEGGGAAASVATVGREADVEVELDPTDTTTIDIPIDEVDVPIPGDHQNN